MLRSTFPTLFLASSIALLAVNAQGLTPSVAIINQSSISSANSDSCNALIANLTQQNAPSTYPVPGTDPPITLSTADLDMYPKQAGQVMQLLVLSLASITGISLNTPFPTRGRQNERYGGVQLTYWIDNPSAEGPDPLVYYQVADVLQGIGDYIASRNAFFTHRIVYIEVGGEILGQMIFDSDYGRESPCASSRVEVPKPVSAPEAR